MNNFEVSNLNAKHHRVGYKKRKYEIVKKHPYRATFRKIIFQI